jgi:hypothetical protein
MLKVSSPKSKVMPLLYLSYIDLTPGLENPFSDLSHKIILAILREQFLKWSFFFTNYPDHSLGYIVTTRKETKVLEVKGPTIFKKKKVVDYSIFIPNSDYDINQYIDLVFEGIGISLKAYQVEEKQIILMREECKRKLLK